MAILVLAGASTETTDNVIKINSGTRVNEQTTNDFYQVQAYKLFVFLARYLPSGTFKALTALMINAEEQGKSSDETPY